MSFATEIAYFDKERQAWLEDHEGEWVAVKGEDIGGFFGEFEQAFEVGFEKFGTEQFLVKRVLPEDEVFLIFQLTVRTLH
jgi:hypothetical protein